MDKVKFGIIGMGNMGTGHLGYFCAGKIKNGEVTAVADVNPAKLEAVSLAISARRLDVATPVSAKRLDAAAPL